MSSGRKKFRPIHDGDSTFPRRKRWKSSRIKLKRYGKRWRIVEGVPARVAVADEPARREVKHDWLKRVQSMIEGVPRGLTLFRFRSGSRARLQFVRAPRLGLRERRACRREKPRARGFGRMNFSRDRNGEYLVFCIVTLRYACGVSIRSANSNVRYKLC
ncbi:hypothetical protein X777_12032 [Ooceraea biroi]|uniref:Uncharacterized protein n=1 Tax=Ooceraea biroi TaxID=2015173 RepID=A0A026WZ40_OOCBI|nr:hypothetical protein X777_12032 [Ooceraea biroi]